MLPSFMFPHDARRINMNTIPLAPQRATLKKTMLIAAVSTAVTAIMNKRRLLPYFSSSIGPRIRMKLKLPIKCAQPPWPIT